YGGYTAVNTPSPVSVEVGELTGDTLAEMVVVSSTNQVAVYSGVMFSLLTQYSFTGGRGAAIGDWNGDGANDFAAFGNPYANTFLGQRPLPVAADPSYTFTTPVGAQLLDFRRGVNGMTTDWVYYGAAASPGTVTLPTPSSLAPSRAAPSTQKVAWRTTFQSGSPAIDLNNLKLPLLRPSWKVTNGVTTFRRQ